MGKWKRRTWTAEMNALLLTMYRGGKSSYAIGEHFGMSQATVLYHLKRLKQPRRKTHEHGAWRRCGADHHNWNGGRRIEHGYVCVLDTDTVRKRRYVLEHRLVMERHLQATDPSHPALSAEGTLRDDWIVHHKNGKKADNSIDNLEPLPRDKHHPWITYREENARLLALLRQHGISPT